MFVLHPHEHLTEEETTRGLRFVVADGVCSQIMASLAGGAFLVAFALHLGASTLVIGLLAAIPQICQLLQLPTILLVERLRLRKLLAVSASGISRLTWIPIVALPFVFPAPTALLWLLGLLALHYGLGTISACAWNSWMRDFVPDDRMGRFFGRRLAIATVVGALLSLVAAGVIDASEARGLAGPKLYAGVLAVGGACGLLGVGFLASTPEPRMPPRSIHGVLPLLIAPLREHNFRQLLRFLAPWTFAINLAAPFFVVYMLTVLQVEMRVVLALAVLSQLVNAVFLGVWGRLADRFSNKSILAVSGPLFLLSIALWPFTSMPDPHRFTFALLVGIHVLAGASTAGVTLCSGNIALELAPRGTATAFLAVSALVNGSAAALAPILGGLAAQQLATRGVSLVVRWGSRAAPEHEFAALQLAGLDFVFVAAVVMGLYAGHRLLSVREEGEVEEDIVVAALYAEARRTLRDFSNVAGLKHLTNFPWVRMEEVAVKESAEHHTQDPNH